MRISKTTIFSAVFVITFSCKPNLQEKTIDDFFYKTDLPSKKNSLENHVYKRIDSLYDLASGKKILLRNLEFDNKGNLVNLAVNNGHIEYVYNDTILSEERGYHRNKLNSIKKYSKINGRSIDSCFYNGEKEVSAIFVHYKNENDMDSLITLYSHSDTTKQFFEYDDFGFKKSINKIGPAHFINKRINNDRHKKVFLHVSEYDDGRKATDEKETFIYNDYQYLIEYKSEKNLTEEHNIHYKKKYHLNKLMSYDVYYINDKPVFKITYKYIYR